MELFGSIAVTRKQLFEYDQALTLQRNGVYIERRRILQRENVRDWIIEYAERSLYDLLVYLQQLTKNKGDTSIYQLKIQELLGIPFKLQLQNNEKQDKWIFWQLFMFLTRSGGDD